MTHPTALESTLEDISRRRAGFKDRRDAIDEELKARRAALLAEEQNQIEDLMAKARAQGATLGDLKRAYGTKDHRTVTTIVDARQAEVKYWQEAFRSGEAQGQWFVITDDTVLIDDVVFELITMEGGTIMLSTETPQWNDDFTVENKIVKEYDAKTEHEHDGVREIAEAYRKRG